MSELLTAAQATEADAVAEITREAAEPKQLDPGVPQAIVIPRDAQLVQPDLSAWRDKPFRKTGTYRPATVDAFVAFVAFVKDQQDDQATTVWVHPTSGRVVAVLDDNGDQPGYRQHQAVLQLAHTPEWDYWIANDRKMLGQEQFAEHIEGGLEEIQLPVAADMLEIAQSFHARTGAEFRSSKRLDSGEQQLQYDEKIEAKAGQRGDLTVPTVIMLAIAPFIAEQPYKITARLRFRLTEGRLTLGYLLDRPDVIVRDALEGVAERVAAEFPRTYVGDAPTG